MVGSHFKKIKNRLKTKLLEDKKRLRKKHLRSSKLLASKGLKAHKLREHAIKLLTGATMASALLTQPVIVPMLPKIMEKDVELSEPFKESLRRVLPANRGQLNPWEVGMIAQSLKTNFGVEVDAELSGQRLNHQYGLMGMEQHLQRFPGDSLSQHDEMREAGMAPGLGAWGYFVNSETEMTKMDVLREKYYVAVQTLYLPEWNNMSADELRKRKEWYKYRKVVVVNSENGKALIAVIGDAGPADWTGRQFGGSPEVMKELELHEGSREGRVVVLFVEDPSDKVALGPLNIKNIDEKSNITIR